MPFLSFFAHIRHCSPPTNMNATPPPNTSTTLPPLPPRRPPPGAGPLRRPPQPLIPLVPTHKRAATSFLGARRRVDCAVRLSACRGTPAGCCSGVPAGSRYQQIQRLLPRPGPTLEHFLVHSKPAQTVCALLPPTTHPPAPHQHAGSPPYAVSPDLAARCEVFLSPAAGRCG